MLNLINDNLLILSGYVTAVFAYFFGGRQKQKNDNISQLQGLYREFLNDHKIQMDRFTERINALEAHEKQLQSQFNELQLSYAKEVEKSQNWEKLHRELLHQYNELKAKHEKLRREFEQYKKKVEQN